MKRNMILIFFAVIPLLGILGQSNRGVAGYHIGIVQPILASQNGELHYIDEADFYAIGFPMGITFHTKGSAKFDFEFVPLIKPYVNLNNPYDVHLLFHPGVLFPLSGGFTFGLRLAFETGAGQFGFTPLINKSFELSDDLSFFVELVAPARFGPNKDSGYTQVFGLHIGLGL